MHLIEPGIIQIINLNQTGLSTVDNKFTILGGDIFEIKFKVLMCQYLKG